MAPRKRIAAVVTAFYEWSHADVIVGKFIRGFPTDDGLIEPSVDIVSLYMDQLGGGGGGGDGGDVGTKLAERFGVRICDSILEALTLGEGELSVDGVLAIGEHGQYPNDELGRKVYPRRHLFQQITAVFASSGRVVPVFTDKHLAHSWEDAAWIYSRSQELGVPHMAGSSVPLYWRIPHPSVSAEAPADGAPLEEALALSYGGLEAYGYHGLEALQSMLEARPGGETGLRSVQCITGAGAVWQAALDGHWPLDLATTAIVSDRTAAASRPDPGRDGRTIPRDGSGNVEQTVSLDSAEDVEAIFGSDAAAILLRFSDGFRATLLHASSGQVASWAFAGRYGGGQLQSFSWRSHESERAGEPFPAFSYLGLNIERMFLTGEPTIPVERTLLVTGAIDATMRSVSEGGAVIETDELSAISYVSPDLGSLAMPSSPDGPSGASTQPFVPAHFNGAPKL